MSYSIRPLEPRDEAAWRRLFRGYITFYKAIIADEVFVDYPMDAGAAAVRARFARARTAVVCLLGGMSKTIGLPQAKLGWIALAGAPALMDATLARLELVCGRWLPRGFGPLAGAGRARQRGASSLYPLLHPMEERVRFSAVGRTKRLSPCRFALIRGSPLRFSEPLPWN